MSIPASLASSAILIDSELLLPAGKILLLGAFGISLLNSIREDGDIWLSFEGLAVGFFAIVYFSTVLKNVFILTDSLTELISKVGSTSTLKEIILENLSQAAKRPAPGNPSINIPAIVEQIWRLGVWGIMSQIVDFCFLVASWLLSTARCVFIQIVAFLSPLVCGLYPLLPGLLKNMSAFVIELALWDVVLKLIQALTGVVANAQLSQDWSLGLPIVTVELVAIILILMVPTFTHRIVSGSLNSDVGGVTASTLSLGRNWVWKAASFARGRL